MSDTCIYGLIDPDTLQLRYIGKSIRPKERLTNQMNEKTKCHRTNWLRSLRSRGLKPIQLILEKVNEEDWQKLECEWIRNARMLGFPLVNGTDGGDGLVNPTPEARAKMIATWTGRKHKPETIEKLKAARALRVTSDETRAKMSRSQTGRKITWIDSIATALRKITKEEAASIVSRLANGEKVKDLAVEFGVHRTTISKVNMGTYFEPYRK